MLKKLVKLVAILIIFSGVASSAYSPLDVETKIYCPCGCGEILYSCECETAVAAKTEISRELTSGKTPDEIIQKFVNQYGSAILVNAELEAIKSASRNNNVNPLPFYLAAIVITGIIAYQLGSRSKNKGRKGGKKPGKDNDWEL
ncbi:cytochrome c-type biogenesis protein [Geoglobus acetivorans]|uniref:Cytochrome c-type biogenesis protein CcmH n=1 Tax=Geoglobus acetivorans TaxID=565033 RepID=A0A0A7GGC2_GEOAI|nr:hypothetical protein GACE_2070 [Geoglobus acetivorans]MBE8539620.1 cytochrome c-type biogenesis protein CcmH [Geoglobus acetivorans]